MRAVGGLEFWNFGDWWAYFGAEFDVTEQVEIWGELYVSDTGFGGVRVGAELDLGMIDPYAFARWSNGRWYFEGGADFEKQIGTGPLSLIGDARVWYGTPCCGFGFEAGVGIRYTMGDHDDYRARDYDGS